MVGHEGDVVCLVHDHALLHDVVAVGELHADLEVLLDQQDGDAFGLDGFSCATISSTITGARPSTGSSRISRRGWFMSARPMASICCSPPESCPPPLRRRSFRRGNIL
jgi:hypothetical protein